VGLLSIARVFAACSGFIQYFTLFDLLVASARRPAILGESDWRLRGEWVE
jgi:hypothetical protein